MQRRLWIALALGLSACDGGGSMDDDDAGMEGDEIDPAIVDTWFTQVTDPTADNQSETVTFTADGEYTAVHDQTNSDASADHAGCVESVTETGTFDTNDDGTMITITPSGDMAERSYAGCNDPSEDGAGDPATPIFFQSAATVPYEISGDTLTLVEVMFERQ